MMARRKPVRSERHTAGHSAPGSCGDTVVIHRANLAPIAYVIHETLCRTLYRS